MLAVVCLILLIAGALCFLLATFPSVVITKVNIVALGLFFWIMVALIDAAKALH
jgi:hypothetical protein